MTALIRDLNCKREFTTRKVHRLAPCGTPSGCTCRDCGKEFDQIISVSDSTTPEIPDGYYCKSCLEDAIWDIPIGVRNKVETKPIENIREKVFDEIGDDDKVMFMEGYDDCITGVVYRYGNEPIVCYDYDRLIERHKKDGMTHEEAEEFLNFNQLGAGMGPKTPCFMKKLQRNGGIIFG